MMNQIDETLHEKITTKELMDDHHTQHHKALDIAGADLGGARHCLFEPPFC